MDCPVYLFCKTEVQKHVYAHAMFFERDLRERCGRASMLSVTADVD